MYPLFLIFKFQEEPNTVPNHFHPSSYSSQTLAAGSITTENQQPGSGYLPLTENLPNIVRTLSNSSTGRQVRSEIWNFTLGDVSNSQSAVEESSGSQASDPSVSPSVFFVKFNFLEIQ